ncbi:MAG: fused MFS/spermidine synthase [Gemmatimonadetes bacterium]|nr:fused MFS/spermidine synthase [Gemmatimonadota bacterium]
MATALSCLFLSGAASLFYEVCWIRKAGLFFGSTTFALATVLAVFFLGLAIGSALAGRLSMSLHRPLRIYGIVELAIAVLGLASNMLLDAADDGYGMLYRWADGSAPWIALARLVLVAAVILVPAVLMGTTVPLLARAIIRRHRSLGFAAGGLYGINALGAATGAALAGFVTLPVLGLAATIYLGAGLNVLCGVAVLLVCWQTHSAPLAEPSDREEQATDARRTLRIPVLLPLFFLTGSVGVAIEILWARYLPLMITSSVYAYTLPLVVILLGIGIGSLVIAPLCDRSRHPIVVFGCLQAFTGLSVLVAMKLSRDIWTALAEAAPELISANHFMGLHGAMLLPGALASGASFPLVVRLVSKNVADASWTIGRLTAINTAGSIASAVIMAWGLSWLGLDLALRMVTGMAIVGGCVAFAAGAGRQIGRRVAALLIAFSVIGWGLAATLLKTRLPHDHLSSEGTLLEVVEGQGASLAVVQLEDKVLLGIDRLWQGSNKKNQQTFAGHLPMLLHGDGNETDVLVVGMGTGQAAGRFLLWDVHRLDCLDVEVAVFDLARRYFGATWLDDPRVRALAEDGRDYIRHSQARYDVIGIEVGQLFRPGIISFYTEDFYQRLRQRLKPGGLVTQFVPVRMLSTPQVLDIVATFISAFPQSQLWFNGPEFVLIGRRADAFALDISSLEERLERPEIRRDLHYRHPLDANTGWLNESDSVLGSFLASAEDLRSLSRGGRILTDDVPRFDYELDPHQDIEVRTVGALLEIAKPLHKATSAALDGRRMARIEQRRKQNLYALANLIVARGSKALQAGQLELAERTAREVLAEVPAHTKALWLLERTKGRLDKEKVR